MHPCFLARYILAAITRRHVFTLLRFKNPVIQISNCQIFRIRNSRKLPRSRAFPMLHSDAPAIRQSHPRAATRFPHFRSFTLPRLRSATHSHLPASAIPQLYVPKLLLFYVSTLSYICIFARTALSAPVSSRLRTLVPLIIDSAAFPPFSHLCASMQPHSHRSIRPCNGAVSPQRVLSPRALTSVPLCPRTSPLPFFRAYVFLHFCILVLPWPFSTKFSISIANASLHFDMSYYMSKCKVMFSPTRPHAHTCSRVFIVRAMLYHM